MDKIKIAIAGLGNCASSLIQGIFYYSHEKQKEEFIPGILHNKIAGYRISDIELVAVFDIDKNKVGKDISEAIFSKPNCTKKICKIPYLNQPVLKGSEYDSIGENLKNVISVDKTQKSVNVSNILKERQADMLINFLPTGSQKATEYYAKQALSANCGFINAIPVFIASNPNWEKKFRDKNLPIVGDDIKSQIGATILHRSLVSLLAKRGVSVDDSYQLNIGGNTDFINLSEPSRLKSKIISKTESVRSATPYNDNIIVANPQYVPYLNDTKICYININGKNFGNLPVSIELKLTVEDSPNSAGIMVDVIRSLKVAKDNGIGGARDEICSYFFKHPPHQMDDNSALIGLRKFLNDPLN